MASRLFVSRDTLWRLERGDPTIALGTVATAAFILQLHDRLANLAAPATDTIDLNPVPEIERAQTPKTAVTEEQEEPTIAVALAAAPRFGMKSSEARAILRKVHATVSRWRSTGKRLQISAKTLDAYASAFEHPLRDEASRLL